MERDGDSRQPNDAAPGIGLLASQHLSSCSITILPMPTAWRLALIPAFLLAMGNLFGCASEEPPLADSAQTYIKAKELLDKGQKDEALAALNASIEEKPTYWALRDRARLLAERGEDDAARKDCEAALEISPEDADILWIKGELAKPKAQRFQGKLKEPPSSNR
jgi:tetratricopeptide (TPR) repeat protein